MQDFKEMEKFIGEEFQEIAQGTDNLKDFHALLTDIERDGALPKKTKILIAISLAVKSQCTYCLASHIRAAINAGATDEEIMESAWVAVLMGGGPSLMYVLEVKKALKEMRGG